MYTHTHLAAAASSLHQACGLHS